MDRAHIGALVLSAALAGCGVGATPGVDAGAGSGDGGGDASTPSAGLLLRFVGDPDRLPEDVDGGHLDSVELDLENVILMGDGGIDERTTEAQHSLAFDGEDSPILFSNAPPSRYSRFLATIDAYQLRGCAVENEEEPGDGTCVPFEIDDPNPNLPVEVEFDVVELDPGGFSEITMQISLAYLIDEIEWETVSLDGDTLVIDPDHPNGLDQVRSEMVEAFRYQP